ncbi:MAG TPA: TAXI family TRAP transporter solute-binding subunit [Thiolinea sp.]|nr:TAXI family TRAP transporter solute-binding subunit [Thiolinea sp.]
MPFACLKNLILIAGLMLLALPVWAAKVSMETATSNSVLGLLPQTMAPYWSRAGVDVELATGQTLTKSLLKIGQDNLDSAVIPPLAYMGLSTGKGAYTRLGAEKGAEMAEHVRALFGFSSSFYHPIVWADSGIENWADLKGRKIYIGPPAGAANAQITALLKTAAGFEDGKDYEGIKAPWGVAIQGFRDGQYDMVFSPQPLGSQALTELSLSRDIRILSLPADTEPPASLGLITSTIPPDTYSGQVNKNETVTVWVTVMMLAVNRDMAEDTAYTLTKTYFDNLDAARKANDLLKTVSADQRFDGVVAPLHAGAVRYYREQAIDIPAALLTE